MRCSQCFWCDNVQIPYQNIENVEKNYSKWEIKKSTDGFKDRLKLDSTGLQTLPFENN